MSDEFETSPAVRKNVPLIIGIFGAAGSGKTCSALELATGIAEVYGGDVHGIDTEERRMCNFAFDPATGKGYKFEHTPFKPPFGPDRYMRAFDHVLAKKPGCIIVDSASHEHEGPGGVLERQAEIAQELAKKWNTSIEKAGQAAWNEVKKPRKAFVQRMIQLNTPTILCFRSREQTKQIGSKMVDCGFGAIGCTDYLYEALVSFFLEPKSMGFPTWDSDKPNERLMMKLPGQFEALLNPGNKPARITRDIGRKLAEWAKGAAPEKKPDEKPARPIDELIAAGDAVAAEGLDQLKDFWKKTLSEAERNLLGGKDGSLATGWKTAASSVKQDGLPLA